MLKKFLEEFKKFISKGNVMDMAVGIIIGGAFTSIVSSLVNDIINPVLGLFGGMNFDQYRQCAQTRPCAGHEETLQALADHWFEMQAEMEQTPAQENGGMTLG